MVLRPEARRVLRDAYRCVLADDVQDLCRHQATPPPQPR